MKRRLLHLLQSWGFCLPPEVDPRFDRQFRSRIHQRVSR